jgi:hypothetical protein
MGKIPLNMETNMLINKGSPSKSIPPKAAISLGYLIRPNDAGSPISLSILVRPNFILPLYGHCSQIKYGGLGFFNQCYKWCCSCQIDFLIRMTPFFSA